MLPIRTFEPSGITFGSTLIVWFFCALTPVLVIASHSPFAPFFAFFPQHFVHPQYAVSLKDPSGISSEIFTTLSWASVSPGAIPTSTVLLYFACSSW